MRIRNLFIYVCIAASSLFICACSDPGPSAYPIGYPWESEAGNVTVMGYTLTESYTLTDGSLIEAEEGNILLAIELETQFNQGWILSEECQFGKQGDYEPKYFPLCEPVFLDETKMVLLYSMPEEEACGAEFEWYFLDLRLLGHTTISRTFFLAESAVSE